MFARRVAPALVLIALGAACSTPPRLTADQYYTEGKGAFDSQNYEVAVRNYKELLDQYPFDPHAEEAEISIAQAHYKKKQYAEAITAFNDFQRMHPMSPELPKVYYLLGKSFEKQMTTPDRDQGAADNAQGWYRVVVERYPGSDYTPRAQRRMAKCRESMAEHERLVAKFYIKQGNLRAAKNRVKGLLEKFPDTVATTQALEDLATAYEHRGDATTAELDAVTAEEIRGVANERAAAFASMPESGPGSRAEGAVPTAHTPASDVLLAELVAAFGPSESTVAAAPALIDPVAAPKIPTGSDPGSYGSVGGGGNGGLGRRY